MVITLGYARKNKVAVLVIIFCINASFLFFFYNRTTFEKPNCLFTGIIKNGDSITLNEKGKLFADKIASDLFFIC